MTWDTLSPERKIAVKRRVYRSLQQIGTAHAASVRSRARDVREFDSLTIEETIGALQEMRDSGAVQMIEGETVMWRVKK